MNDFRDHLLNPYQNLDESIGFLDRLTSNYAKKKGGISYDPQMVNFQKHYNDSASHRLVEPHNKARYAEYQTTLRGGKTNTPAFKSMMKMVQDQDPRK